MKNKADLKLALVTSIATTDVTGRELEYQVFDEIRGRLPIRTTALITRSNFRVTLLLELQRLGFNMTKTKDRNTVRSFINWFGEQYFPIRNKKRA